jgi:hypothetical protein
MWRIVSIFFRIDGKRKKIFGFDKQFSGQESNPWPFDYDAVMLATSSKSSLFQPCKICLGQHLCRERIQLMKPEGK